MSADAKCPKHTRRMQFAVRDEVIMNRISRYATPAEREAVKRALREYRIAQEALIVTIELYSKHCNEETTAVVGRAIDRLDAALVECSRLGFAGLL